MTDKILSTLKHLIRIIFISLYQESFSSDVRKSKTLIQNISASFEASLTSQQLRFLRLVRVKLLADFVKLTGSCISAFCLSASSFAFFLYSSRAFFCSSRFSFSLILSICLILSISWFFFSNDRIRSRCSWSYSDFLSFGIAA